jgi:cupin superfamily acireductone dioxygenase involved in methionine salvage
MEKDIDAGLVPSSNIMKYVRLFTNPPGFMTIFRTHAAKTDEICQSKRVKIAQPLSDHNAGGVR